MTTSDESAPSVDVLDPDALIAAAVSQTGLDDFGDDGYLDSMRRWCTAIHAEGRVNPLGYQLIQASILRVLVNRLRMERDLREHPEILDEDVSSPIIVTGFTRTGTTKLQRMMSMHPGVQRLETWRLMNPAPMVPLGTEPDPRIQVAEESTAMMEQMFPDWVAGHSSQACEVDEEIFVMEMTFEVVTFWRVSVPTFERWCRSRPRETPYKLLKRVLQYLQWQDPTRRGRPFVMKSPWHLGNLDLLAEHFPGATVVCCHRDNRVAMASGSRLMEVLRDMCSDDVDLAQAGRDEVGFWAAEGKRHLAQRRALGDRLRIVDAAYPDILDEPLKIIREVMATHGLEVTSDDERLMTEWGERNPQYRHGRHVYTLERYGLTAAEIDSAFADYDAYFAISREVPR